MPRNSILTLLKLSDLAPRQLFVLIIGIIISIFSSDLAGRTRRRLDAFRASGAGKFAQDLDFKFAGAQEAHISPR